MGFFNAKCNSNARLQGKTVVITGCNTGIGKCTVQDLYKRGARVIMACRTVSKAEEAAKDIEKACEGQENLGEIAIVQLDLTSMESIRSCAKKLLEEESEINILINNAGIMCCPKSQTEDGFELQFGTNHLGHFLLTLLLLPKIIRSTPARIVNVSSIAHSYLDGTLAFDDLNWEKRTYSPTQAYVQSKLANILFTKELTKRLQDANIQGVTTYSLHPGVINTELSRHLDETIFKGFSWLYTNIGSIFIKTPEEGAQTTIHCAVDENAGNETGLYYAECKVKDSSSKSKNMDDAKKLWDISVKMVGLEDYNPFVPSGFSDK